MLSGHRGNHGKGEPMKDLTALKEHLVREIDEMLGELDSCSLERGLVHVVNRDDALPDAPLSVYFVGNEQVPGFRPPGGHRALRTVSPWKRFP